jgi:uncharacterized protein YjbJ (UPF0337 family)
MNESIIKGKWNQMKGSIRNHWGEITDEDLAILEGDAQKLSWIIQERYGKTQEEADKEIREFGSK